MVLALHSAFGKGEEDGPHTQQRRNTIEGVAALAFSEDSAIRVRMRLQHFLIMSSRRSVLLGVLHGRLKRGHPPPFPCVRSRRTRRVVLGRVRVTIRVTLFEPARDPGRQVV